MENHNTPLRGQGAHEGVDSPHQESTPFAQGMNSPSQEGDAFIQGMNSPNQEGDAFIQGVNSSINDFSFVNQIHQPTLVQASTGVRFVAFLIDHIILIIVLLLPTFMIVPAFSGASFAVVMFVAFLLYAMRDMVKGQSPGKFLFGIAVRDQTDPFKIPTLSKLFVRNLFTFLWFIDFFVLLATKTKIGDKLVKTNVYQLDKKPKLIVRLAVAFIVPVIVIVIFVLGFGSRTPLSPEEFTTRMEGEGYVVEDITYQYAEDDEIVTVLSVGTRYLRIDFAVFTSERRAIQIHNWNQQHLNNMAGQGIVTSRTSIDLPGFNRFTVLSGERYDVVSRIGDTIIIASSPAENRDDLNRLLRLLGY